MSPKFSIHPNIAQAETLSSEFYENPEIFIDCKEKIFAASWQKESPFTGFLAVPGQRQVLLGVRGQSPVFPAWSPEPIYMPIP